MKYFSSPQTVNYPLLVREIPALAGRKVRQGEVVLRCIDESGNSISIAAPFGAKIEAYLVNRNDILHERVQIAEVSETRRAFALEKMVPAAKASKISNFPNNSKFRCLFFVVLLALNLWFWMHAVSISNKFIWQFCVLGFGAGVPTYLLFRKRLFNRKWREKNTTSLTLRTGISTLMLLSVAPGSDDAFPWTGHATKSKPIIDFFVGVALLLPASQLPEVELKRLEEYVRENF